MKKLLVFTFLFLVFIFFTNCLEINAKVEEVSDYLTYQEIIMSSGKLIKNFTEDERKEILAKSGGSKFMGIEVIPECQSVKASYIASVKECMENMGSTPITINVDYSVETNTKVSFSSSGSVSASGGGTISKVKAEASAKANVEYSKTTTESIKEKRTLSITVEPGSQYMVVTKGNLSVSNGMVEVYFFWIRTCYGCYEFVTLESQYAALEKRTI
ncbi:MAG: hypothetical protein IKP77_07380 [Acholeplasmatales bacterium]|nr:hypothetical protein [Acholeplasmatales bacterium]